MTSRTLQALFVPSQSDRCSLFRRSYLALDIFVLIGTASQNRPLVPELVICNAHPPVLYET